MQRKVTLLPVTQGQHGFGLERWGGKYVARPSLPVISDLCEHRGSVLDRTRCGKVIHHCKRHNEACSNSGSDGVRLCRGCQDISVSSLPESWVMAPDVWYYFRVLIERARRENMLAYLSAVNHDGIVIVGGGKYFASTYCNVRLIRDLGCSLPVEVWHLQDEMPDKWRKLLEPYGVECINAEAKRAIWPMRRLGGWELKSYAVAHSKYRRLIYLDADCYPMKDPTFVLSDPEFQRVGAVFHADPACYGDMKAEWMEALGIPYRKAGLIESGAFVVDRVRFWQSLLMAKFLNGYSDLLYRHGEGWLYGDKDTFGLAAMIVGQKYLLAPNPTDCGSWGLCQPWLDGECLWQHRIHCKPKLKGDVGYMSGQYRGRRLKHDNQIYGYLSELRKRLKEQPG